MTVGRCVICGAMGTERWTLDNGDIVVVTDLCVKDSAPLNAIMEAAGPVPPSRQLPLDSETEVPRRQPRRRSMLPLVEWTPPSDPPLLTPEDGQSGKRRGPKKTRRKQPDQAPQ